MCRRCLTQKKQRLQMTGKERELKTQKYRYKKWEGRIFHSHKHGQHYLRTYDKKLLMALAKRWKQKIWRDGAKWVKSWLITTATGSKYLMLNWTANQSSPTLWLVTWQKKKKPYNGRLVPVVLEHPKNSPTVREAALKIKINTTFLTLR